MKCHAMMFTAVLVFSTVANAEVKLLENGQPSIQIVADVRGATPAGSEILKDAAGWLGQSLERASGAAFVVASEVGDQPSLVVARVDQWPDVARAAGLTSQTYDDYAIATRSDERRLYVRRQQ